MSRSVPLEQRAATILIALCAFAALLLAAFSYGAGHGRPTPLPAQTWKHSVAFRAHQREERS